MELAAGSIKRGLVSLKLSLGNRLYSQILLSPVRTSRVNEKDLDMSFPFSIHH
jgi:hypothetical protein